MLVLLLSVSILLLYLIVERVRIDRWQRLIPKTIIVTGTRGKSSVVRMLASVLRADGQRVLAKTTGSSPSLLWPDGSETEIKRRGSPTILEQKDLLKQAAASSVDFLVAEVMSIHPENHLVEAQKILRPDTVVVTNSWPDHIDAQGKTQNAVAVTLSHDIPESATVVLPAGSHSSVLESAVEAANGKLEVVEGGLSVSIRQRIRELEKVEFPENIDLVCGVAKHIGIDDEHVTTGLASMSRDPGALSILQMQAGEAAKRLFLVNAFAANDPTSTLRVLAKTRELVPETSDVVGVLCLRSDRADRTAHWLEVLENGSSQLFSRLYVTGGHSRVVARRLTNAQRLKHSSAEHTMDAIASDVGADTVVFGFGNYVGMGGRLARFWHREGSAYGV